MIPVLSVWQHARVVGWDGRADTMPNTQGWPVMDAVAAMTERWHTDAHAPGYVVPGNDPKIPRLTNAALAPLIDAQSEPRIATVFVDVDQPGHEKWASADAAVAEVDRLMDMHGEDGGALATAGVYTTRAGFRLVFRPVEPVPVSVYRAWMVGNDGNGGFLGYLSKATGIPMARDGSGGIDPTCAEWTRCYRLPYVVRDGVPTNPHVDLSRYVALACPWQPREAPKRVVPVPTAGTAAAAYADGIPPMPGPGEITGDQWAKLADHPITSRFLEALRTGTVLAKKGSRDTTLVRVTGAVLVALGSKNPLDAWRVLARSVAADDSEGAPSLTKLWEKCQHFASRENDRAALGARARVQPPIVYSGSRYYVLDHARNTYRPPVASAAVCAALERHGPPGLVTRDGSGAPRQLAEYLADYGSPAHSVIAEMGRERTEYDPDTNDGTLFERCCALRADVTPTRHADVDEWLRLLGGIEADTLLDWLATAVDTSNPTAALYIEGDPGAGKGMLVAGLAALWGAGAVAYRDATAAFNGALAQCPIVHLDEGLSDVAGNDGFSAGFRTLVAETSRPLRRKFMEPATIVGCPRAMVTANNRDALRIRERLTAMDLEAIALRIVYILTDRRAVKYLERIGGRSATSTWVEDRSGATPKVGKIGQHVLWLRANRQVTPGTRFLVQGRMTDFHRDLAITSGINGGILSLLANLAEKGGKQPGVIFGAVAANGASVVLVNSPAVRRAWSGILQSSPPDDSEIAASLRALSLGDRRTAYNGTRLRYYEIPAESVLRIADLHQIGDPDVITKRLTTPDMGQVLPMPISLTPGGARP